MRRNVLFPLNPVVQEFGNMVDEFVNKGLHDVFGGKAWQNNFPAVNIMENENNFSIDMAAPGLQKHDFKINVENNKLHVSVNLEQSEEKKEDAYFRKEFNFKSFKRSFQLPEHADTSKISAAYNNGVLNISIQKKEIIKDEKNIEVQ
ncbi:MAG: HSP20 family small heat-shock protein [Saprospiraceae bacterium]